MSKPLKKNSLKENTLTGIGEFLYEEKFPRTPLLKEGLLELIDLIADYQEEGQKLYPEIILVTDWDYFKSISNREIIIKVAELSVSEFSNILKLCAPLAVGNWNIVIEIKDNQLKYGLIDAEIIETSPSLYEQTVGSLGVIQEEFALAYIRNIGIKTVELIGQHHRLVVSLSLDDLNLEENDDIQNICNEIVSNCEFEIKQTIQTFITKTINEAIRIGHGNLIAIVEDDETIIAKIKEDFNDCIYLEKPIDFQEFIRNCESEKSNDTSVNLISHSKILMSMLNHDGIIIISNTAKIIGYHMFIPRIDGEEDVLGGARTRAFQSMKNSKKFVACLYKSQDGNSKFWKRDE
jgi:predicted small metal-binding protein